MIRKLPPSPVPILQQDNPLLRRVARPIEAAEFGTPSLQQIITRMNAALDSQEDGVAIAAPQIGESVRIFIIAKKAFSIDEAAATETPAAKKRIMVPKENIVFINPTITRASKKTQKMDEGCLSVRFLYGTVRRAEKATVEAYDITGKKFTYHGSGLIAEIFQHEIDHLDGILFIDKATRVRELPPETYA